MGDVGPRSPAPQDVERAVVAAVVPDAMAAVRAGSHETFGNFAEQCRAYLLHVATRELSGDLRAKVGASDLVQETLLEAQQQIGRFRGQTEAELLGWLRQILLHKVAHTGRHYRATAKRNIAREFPLEVPDASGQIAFDLPDQGQTPSKQLMADERVAALRQAIERLGPEHRQVILLRTVEQRSFAEVGTLMLRSEKAACKLWLRAVAALRETMDTADDSR